MPYRPTEDTYQEQAQKWFQDHPEAVAFLRDNGITGDDPRLIDPRFARNNPDAGLPPIFLKPLQNQKRHYYRQHPEMDPQSTTSKVLEFLGFDQPYVNDSRSYDYQNKRFQQSLDEGSPDMRWSIPVTDAMQEVGSGSMENNYGEADPRDEREQWAGALDNFLSYPTLGFQDEAAAGIGSLAGDGSYDENLARIRKMQDRKAEHQPMWNQVTETMAALPVDSLGFFASYGLAKRGIGGLRKAAGFAPKAATELGERIGDTAAISGASMLDDATWQMGSGRGGLEGRASTFNPELFALSGTLPVAFAAGGGLKALGKRGIDAARTKLGRSGKRMATGDGPMATVGVDELPPFKPRPNMPRQPIPKLPPRAPDSVRDDLEQAIRASRTRDRG